MGAMFSQNSHNFFSTRVKNLLICVQNSLIMVAHEKLDYEKCVENSLPQISLNFLNKKKQDFDKYGEQLMFLKWF